MRSSTKRGSLQHAKAVTRALAELFLTMKSEGERVALFEATIRWMVQHGLSRQMRHLPRLLTEAWYEHTGAVPAIASTPRGDLGEEREGMIATLATAVEKKVMLEERADPTLIGGAVLAIGDERLDGSLRGALMKLRATLAAPSSLAS